MRDIAAFDRQRYMALATFRRSGAEVRTPVWFAALDGKIYLFTAGESGKVKRLRNSSRARVAPSDMRGQVRGVWWDVAPAQVSTLDATTGLRAEYETDVQTQRWFG